ncbi:uncharacterized protein PpBr36_11030 [Pyricularia pennisetigena]|uniref:uncharacterized protein n=1 Tax=Pyricularia pennisetigena TaxID=1578925 RepID=UPI001153905C|nr:uncharacterized protein PpBr36_11030 [Pyricularia pennisetigena]TLS20688.1 hypothetical protein PpBr36_11030 [Pyricularia pennisetigena]
MAELGVATGILTLATFAFNSGGKLYKTIQEFRSYLPQVDQLLAELSGLNSVLKDLSETSDLHLEVDLTALELTLNQCKQSCEAAEVELRTFCSRSSASRTSLRDWTRLKFSGDGIEGFRQQLLRYTSTVSVALSFANLRASVNSTQAIHACRDLIATTTVNLEAHLDQIQQKLKDLAERNTTGLTSHAAIRQRMEQEQSSTEKGIAFCASLSQEIEKIQLDFFRGRRSSPNIQGSGSTSEMLVSEGLDGCMNHMRVTLEQLEKHRKGIIDGMGTDSTTATSDQETSLDNLQTQARTLKQCLNFCSNVDAALELRVSNIENVAKGDDTIQFMVSTDGKPINGKNQGDGMRLKQAGGHFSEKSLQQLSGDFKAISLHQTGLQNIASLHENRVATAAQKSSFDNRHGPGFKLAKQPVPAATAGQVDV